MFGPLSPGDTGQEVRILQRKLQRLWHYPKDSEITWVYDAQTIRAVYAFQLAQWLLIAEIDPSVYGYLWPKTRAKINSV
jgi:peptidoglycan hydrolase-like protein with peptidoglycan-binding domain